MIICRLGVRVCLHDELVGVYVCELLCMCLYVGLCVHVCVRVCVCLCGFVYVFV